MFYPITAIFWSNCKAYCIFCTSHVAELSGAELFYTSGCHGKDSWQEGTTSGCQRKALLQVVMEKILELKGSTLGCKEIDSWLNDSSPVCNEKDSWTERFYTPDCYEKESKTERSYSRLLRKGFLNWTVVVKLNWAILLQVVMERILELNGCSPDCHGTDSWSRRFYPRL